MADEAGPSGAPVQAQTPEALAEVEADFAKGVLCVKVGEG